MRALRRALRDSLPPPLLRLARATYWQLRQPEPELRLVRPLADPQAAFLDIGANTGLYLQWSLGHFGSAYAVEPNPGLAAYLRDAFAGRATVLPMALSRTPGTLPFYLPHHGGRPVSTRGSLEASANTGLEQTTTLVEVKTLDSLGLPRLGFVKIDVEGHELAVLEGGLERLRRDRPRLLIEIEERHHPDGSARVVALLASLGYSALYMVDGQLRPLGNTPIAALQRPEHAKPVGGEAAPAGLYVNNFLFLHDGDDAGRQGLRRAGLLS